MLYLKQSAHRDVIKIEIPPGINQNNSFIRVCRSKTQLHILLSLTNCRPLLRSHSVFFVHSVDPNRFHAIAVFTCTLLMMSYFSNNVTRYTCFLCKHVKLLICDTLFKVVSIFSNILKVVEQLFFFPYCKPLMETCILTFLKTGSILMDLSSSFWMKTFVPSSAWVRLFLYSPCNCFEI